MKIGFVGLGKLGLPCALAMSAKGHDVIGTDVDDRILRDIRQKRLPYREAGAAELLETTALRTGSLTDVIEQADLVFCAVQTPHDPLYEGVTRIPDQRVDFDYSYLCNAVEEIAACAKQLQRTTRLIIVSTVLPGTYEQIIRPRIDDFVTVLYNPFFIAMGTTIDDFLAPEFVLVGADREDQVDASLELRQFYATIHNRPVFVTDIKTAELIKVAYNTFIGAKIVFANAMMEICHKIGADVDDLASTLELATQRLLSPKYLRGGMGDGGGCHPRDNIAMSYLARKLDLSHDLFSDLMHAREDQTEWLVELVVEKQAETGLPIVLLGKSFKPETNLIVGSPATLMANIMTERRLTFEHIDPELGDPTPTKRALYFIATNHRAFADIGFAGGSVVLDPWRYIPPQPQVEVISIGAPRKFGKTATPGRV